jgi:localization factor PodJL
MALARATPDEAIQPAPERPAPLRAAANDRTPDPRYAELSLVAQAGERRALAAVARLAEEVARLGQAFDARLARADGRLAGELESARAEIAALEQMVLRRLRAVEAGQADALQAVRTEMAAAVERLSAGIDRAERGAAAAAADLGRRLDQLADAAQAREARQAAIFQAQLVESRRRTEQLVEALRADGLRRDAALRAYVETATRRRPGAQLATGLLLALAGAAAALSLTAIGAQLLAARHPSSPPDPGAVRLHLPLRPTLPAELPPIPPSPRLLPPRAAAPGARAPAPAQAPEDYAALSQAIARGDRAALQRAQALAEGGAPVAELLLAKLYEGGEAGLPKDLTLARRWTERAAEAGERAAMHNLAVYMMSGEGGPQDAPAAARWFEKAAEAGVVDAQFNLALLYENGRGVAKNLIEAYRWYSIAANAGDGLARGRAVALEAKLTPKERAMAAASVSAFQPGPAAPAPIGAPLVPPAATLAESQKLLAREGYFIGATDGTDSPAYRAAAASYLHDHPQAQRLVLTP